VTGQTDSADFPTTPGSFDNSFNGVSDAFVARLDRDGSTLAYSTFLGGATYEEGSKVVVDPTGEAYVAGLTSSPDFPTTPGAFDQTYNGAFDGFATKLARDGSSLEYATFLGGTGDDQAFDVAVDPLGDAYVTGATGSSDFPTTPGAFDGTQNGPRDAFVTQLNRDATAPVYSTFLGGTGDDFGTGVFLDPKRNAYVSGGTSSLDFPITPGAFDSSQNGSYDAFATRLNREGSAPVYSTFLGGIGFESGQDVFLDPRGNAAGRHVGVGDDPYIPVRTASPDYPTTPGAFDSRFNGAFDGAVTKLDSSGSPWPEEPARAGVAVFVA
jgi:hypothetical protein